MNNRGAHIDFSSHPALQDLPPISLDAMDSIRLMNRIDSKFVTSEAILIRLLEQAAAEGYRVLEIQGEKISPYRSLYYDTPELRMFRDHHNRRLVRQKVRTRTYLASGDTFLEIKQKNNKGRTRKKRIRIPAEAYADMTRSAEAPAFLQAVSAYTTGQLQARLETLFRRITLVNAAKTERLTIDTALRFVNRDTGQERGLGDAVIIELKQDGRMPSQMKRILLDLRIKPVRVSKYCIGTVLTNPRAPHHRFKVKIRTIEKTIHQPIW